MGRVIADGLSEKGKDSTYRQYGLGDTLNGAKGADDANTMITPGLYGGPGLSGVNYPGNVKYGVLLVIRRNSGNVHQIGWFTDEVWSRRTTDNGATWENWVAVPNAATTAEAEAGAVDTKIMTPAKTHQAFNFFGLGRNGAEDIGNIDDVLKPSGFYVVSPSTTGTLPATASDNAMVFVLSRTGGAGTAQVEQTYYDNVNRQMWHRTARSGSFNPWREIYTAANRPTQTQAEAGTLNNKVMTPLRVHQAFNQYGLGAALGNFTGGPDAITATGFYQSFSGAAGEPFAGSKIWHIERGQGTNQASQIAVDNNGDKAAFRSKFNDVWEPWREFFHTSNVANQSEAEAGAIDNKPMTPLKTHQAFNHFGLGTNSNGRSVDLNTLNEGGIYAVTSSSTNKPAGVNSSQSQTLLVMGEGGLGNRATQILCASIEGEAYIRFKDSSEVWTSWKQIPLEGNDVTFNKVTIPEGDVGDMATRNVLIQTSVPADTVGDNGDVCFVYEP